MKIRTTKPSTGNKYYIRKVNGGYSNAIKGYPTDSECNVLSNCVGYAYGRFNEIGDYGYCKHLAPVNAENFMTYKGSCDTGLTPKVGAVMVWSKGEVGNSSDGAGHVAVVERVVSSTEVYTSESGYGGNAFWNQTRKKGTGNWGASGTYKFIGFIYNPAVSDDEEEEEDMDIEVITSTKIKLKTDAKLWKLDFTTWSGAEAVRTCKTGDIFTAYQIVNHSLGGKYYLIGDDEGFNTTDCEIYVEPTAETIEKIVEVEKIVNVEVPVIDDSLIKVWSASKDGKYTFNITASNGQELYLKNN